MLYDIKTLRLGAFIRVSTKEQALNGFSVAAQQAALEKWAEENGHKIVEWYIDEGVSGRKKVKNRPQMQRMINDAEAGKFDKIIFTKLDRYFRSVSEYHETQKRLEAARVDWKAIHEEYDTSTTDGRFKINLYLTLAEQEADRDSDRINQVFYYKVQQGQPLSGNQPIGYKVGEIDGEKRVVIDEDRKQVVVDLFDHFATYNSKRGAQHYINTKHGLTLNYYAVCKMLKEEKYSGHYRHNPAYCAPIIPRDVWEHVQRLLTRNIKQRNTGRIYPFSGLVKCTTCGHTMTGRYIKNSHGTEYYYYICNRAQADKVCSHKNALREDVLEKRMLDTIEAELQGYILTATVDPQKVDNTQKEKEAITKRMEKLKQLFLADLMSFEEYEKEHKHCKRLLDELMPTETASISAAKTFLENIDVLETYAALDRQEKQAVWRSVIRRIDCNDSNETKPIFL